MVLDMMQLVGENETVVDAVFEKHFVVDSHQFAALEPDVTL